MDDQSPLACLKKAQELREQAEGMKDPAARQVHLDTAAQWEIMARQHEANSPAASVGIFLK